MNHNFNTYPYGHDYGNSKTCGVTYINGVVHELTMPSALREGSYNGLVSGVMGGNLQQLDIIHDRSHVIQVKRQEFFAGELAIEQNPSVKISELTWRGEIERYWSVRSLSMLLVTSGSIIKDKEYGLIVVAGLPIETYKNEENIQATMTALDGRHEFVLDGEKRIAHVTIRKVIMEGSGANIAHGAVGKTKIGIVDIGGRTTDIYMVVGQTPIIGQCQSFNTGVESAVDNFIASFEEEFQFPLTASDAAKLQICYIGDKRYNEVATVRNAGASQQRVDELLARSFGEAGRSIAGFIRRTWAPNLRNGIVASDAEHILFIGGGAHYFYDAMGAIFQNRLSIPPNPQCANAAGYARLALRFLNRDIKEQAS